MRRKLNLTVKDMTFFLIPAVFLLVVTLYNAPLYASPSDNIPAAAMIALDKAKKHIDKKEYDSAIEILQSFEARGNRIQDSKKIGPKGYHHPMVYFFMGNCFLMKNDFSPAQKCYSRAIEVDPDFTGAWLNLARVYYELKNFEKSAQSFMKAYEKSAPQNPEHLYFCGVGYLMAEKYEEAITVFLTLFKDHPEAVTLRWKENYARALIDADRSKEALPLILELAEKSEGETKTRWREMLIHQYLRLDMNDEALAYAVSLTRIDCTDSKWWKAVVHIQLSRGHYREALSALTIYGYLSPFTMEEKRLYADLNLQLDIPSKASEQYKEIIAGSPDDKTLKNLVTAYRKQDRCREALDLVSEYLTDRENADIMMLKADLLYSLKNYPEAREAYQLAAKMKKQKAGRAWLMAGYAAWQCKDINGSRSAFEMASRDSSNRNAAVSALKELDKAGRQ